MVRYIAPTSTPSKDAAWTLTGAASAHLALDEGFLNADDDTTKLTTTTQNAQFTLGFNIKEPKCWNNQGGLSGGRVILRCKTSGSGIGSAQLTINVIEGVSTRATADITPGTSWGGRVLNLTTTEMKSVTDWRNITVQIKRKDNLSTKTTHVSVVELRLPDQGPPMLRPF